MNKKSIKISRPYCAMPWVHLHVGEFGKVKACCVANIPLGNVNTEALTDLWNAEPIIKLRKAFLNGEADNRCAVCHEQERAGAKSIRLETWEKYADLSEFPITTIELPTYFDIRFSNLCNFKCRTCWHGASSKWHAEAVFLKRTKSNQALIENMDDFDLFVQQYGAALKQAKEIYFAGGEPLITEQHYQLLNWLIDENATNCLLRYNTNFSVVQFKQYNLVDMWSKFNKVEVLASIDATGDLGEFIRKEQVWEQFVANRKAIDLSENVTFKLAPTVSILSIYHLPDLYQWAVENAIIQPQNFYVNMLERPYYYNIKAFPKAQKDRVIKKFTTFYKWCLKNEIPVAVIDDFKACVNFILTDDLSQHWPTFLKETETINLLRNENLMDSWYRDLGLKL
jgi:sulfatase maturation enzyme AslB (radical SAM superfamily)